MENYTNTLVFLQTGREIVLETWHREAAANWGSCTTLRRQRNIFIPMKKNTGIQHTAVA